MTEKKSDDQPREAFPVQPGDTLRYYCEGCEAEWDVTFEPKAKEDKASAKEMGAAEVRFCPACGCDEIEV